MDPRPGPKDDGGAGFGHAEVQEQWSQFIDHHPAALRSLPREGVRSHEGSSTGLDRARADIGAR